MTMTKNELNFAKDLDKKLQKIDNKNRNIYKSADQLNNGLNNKNNIKNNYNNNKSLQTVYVTERPLFITTVKSGLFLDPPHEIALLLGLGKSDNNSSNNSINSTTTVKLDKEKPVVMYGYSSKPKVLPPTRSYHAHCGVRSKRETADSSREGPPATMPYGNIMFDRRVVRGSTYANHPVATENTESQAARKREARRRAMARRKAKGYCVQGRMGTPPPVKGRKHEPVQTERYLEEIFDRPVESEAATQTDLFLDRPATPHYVPAKVGVDQETQIYPGELFDFDVEVVPILEVLVGKTIEQSLIEVLEEDEMAELQAQQRRFLELRSAEKAEQQRLEEQERRLAEEKNNRMVEHEEGLRIQKETEERVAAAMLSHGYIADLLPNIVEGLKEQGFLVDEIKDDVEDKFMPWLMAEVKQELSKMVSSRDVLGEIIRDILEARAEMFAANSDHFAAEDEFAGEMDEEEEPHKNGKSAETTKTKKNEVFLIKNILREEKKEKKEQVEEKKSAELHQQVAKFAEHASKVEALVSNLGKTVHGHHCIYCGKMYSRKYGLKIHIRTHTGYKPLKCKICSRRFGDPSNLNKHVRLHSEGVTPYRCDQCSKVLVRRRDLDRHMKARHQTTSTPPSPSTS